MVRSEDELHALLSDALDFPNWYGRNWNAFWDAIVGLVEMPQRLKLVGWSCFEERLPWAAEIMRQCFVDMTEQYEEFASVVEYS